MKKQLAIVVAFTVSILSGACGGGGWLDSPTTPSGSSAGTQTLRFTGEMRDNETFGKMHFLDIVRPGRLRAQLRWVAGPDLDLTLLDKHGLDFVKGTQTTATEEVLEHEVNANTPYLRVSREGSGNSSYTIDVTILR